jgi:hypothetical protein
MSIRRNKHAQMHKIENENMYQNNKLEEISVNWHLNNNNKSCEGCLRNFGNITSKAERGI